MITLVQGYEFKKEVSSASSRLIASDGISKIIVDTIEDSSLVASADVTKDWHSGRWNYQILDENGIVEQGIFKVIPNLEYSEDVVASYWRKILKAVEDRIAGKSVDAANDVTVGDKKISYMNLDELFKLRNFALQKIAEEDAEEGIESSSPNSEKRISFIWSGI